MPDRTTQRELDKFGALLDMIATDGATGPGTLPPAEHIDALRGIENVDRERINQVREAHAQGNAPPDRGKP